MIATDFVMLESKQSHKQLELHYLNFKREGGVMLMTVVLQITSRSKSFIVFLNTEEKNQDLSSLPHNKPFSEALTCDSFPSVYKRVEITVLCHR